MIIIAIVTSAIAVVGIVVGLAQISNANTAELRADMREDFQYVREDFQRVREDFQRVREDIEKLEEKLEAGLREMRNILLQHVQGHSHSPQTTNPAGANADPSEMTSVSPDSHPSQTTSLAYLVASWPGKSSDNFVLSSEANALL